MSEAEFKLTGDTSVLVEFGNEINTDINKKVMAFDKSLKKAHIDGIVEAVPTYRSVLVHYKPEWIKHDQLISRLKEVLENTSTDANTESLVYEIPVLYGGEAGPDLDNVACYCGKTTDEVVKIHSSREYLIYMLGFTPGFPYLGGMDKSIAAPRLEKPRVLIPAGSVGIAGEQTGVYPLDSPGGWQLIGQTPVKLYDSQRERPILLEAGNYIKFKPVSEAEFQKIKSEADAGRYICRTYRKEV